MAAVCKAKAGTSHGIRDPKWRDLPELSATHTAKRGRRTLSERRTTGLSFADVASNGGFLKRNPHLRPTVTASKADWQRKPIACNSQNLADRTGIRIVLRSRVIARRQLMIARRRRCPDGNQRMAMPMTATGSTNRNRASINGTGRALNPMHHFPKQRNAEVYDESGPGKKSLRGAHSGVYKQY